VTIDQNPCLLFFLISKTKASISIPHIVQRHIIILLHLSEKNKANEFILLTKKKSNKSIRKHILRKPKNNGTSLSQHS
jgi:hypothetical protein